LSAALVTGASGFLGRSLVSALLTSGRPVVALCRNPAVLADLHHPALRTAAGDLGDPASWAPLLSEVTSVFHLAAARNQPQVRAREMEEVNVAATLALARRAGEAGVDRFVHVATALIYGPAEGVARTESDPPAGAFGAYLGSKAKAVLEIRKLAREGLPAVTVCPALVFGPDHPSRPNRITSEIRRLLRGGPRVLVGGGRNPRNLVFADDIVQGLLAAEKLGGIGEEYLLGGEEVSQRDFNKRVLVTARIRGGPGLRIPARAALAAAWAADRLRGHDPGCGYTTAVRTLLSDWRFHCGKAARDLGFRPTSLAEALTRTIQWIREVEG
jgi:dihydroflavonol-4-reductase